MKACFLAHRARRDGLQYRRAMRVNPWLAPWERGESNEGQYAMKFPQCAALLLLALFCYGCGPSYPEQMMAICKDYDKTLDREDEQLVKAEPACRHALGVSPFVAMKNPSAEGQIFLTPGCEDFALELSHYDTTKANQRHCLRDAGDPDWDNPLL